MNSVVAVVSGGLDSVTLAYWLAYYDYAPHLLSFDYGQKHSKELTYAKLAAQRLGARHDVIDLTTLGGLLPGSALTDSTVAVPDGHYQAENMRVTVVPNRNAIMLAIAYGVAAAERATGVAIGVHAGDHHIYPDCRPEFISAFADMQRLALAGVADLRLIAPFKLGSKANIVRIGAAVGVPFGDTWSCYKGGARHCGTCGTCVERREAFQLAGVKDPTIYEA